MISSTAVRQLSRRVANTSVRGRAFLSTAANSSKYANDDLIRSAFPYLAAAGLAIGVSTQWKEVRDLIRLF